MLAIDETTQHLSSALISFEISAEGQELELELRYRLTNANEPVRLLSPRS